MLTPVMPSAALFTLVNGGATIIAAIVGAIAWFLELCETDEVVCQNNPENIYTLCGVGKDDKALAIVTYYSDKEDLPDKEINLDFGKDSKYENYFLDENNDGKHVDITADLRIKMQQKTCVMIKEV